MSDIYLNGNRYAILFKKLGKKLIGITDPENISPVTISIAIIPLSSIINIVIICIIRHTDVTNRLDINNDIRNNTKDIKFIGRFILYGSGKRNATSNTGKNLNNTAANLVPYIVAYHFL